MKDEEFCDTAVEVVDFLRQLREEEDLSAADAMTVLQLINQRQIRTQLNKLSEHLEALYYTLS